MRFVLTSVFAWIVFVFQAFASPPIQFVENKGQWPAQWDYRARIPGGFLNIEKGRFAYTFFDYRKINHHHFSDDDAANERNHDGFDNTLCGHLVQTEFLFSNKNIKPLPFGVLREYFNYYLGNSRQWRSDVRAFEGLLYPSIYENIDLKIYSSGQNMKYDFIVKPGASVEVIRWKYNGDDAAQLIQGEINIKTSLATITEMRPVAYQIIDGKKVFVSCEYVLCDGVFSFSLGDYDSCYELVIDPLLIFSTYSGFSADNWGSTATPGEHGTLYSSGVVNLGNVGGTFPATPGSFQTNYGGLYDVAIYKYDSTGQQLLYASYLGGSLSESPHSLVMDRDNNLLVLGTTSSSNFPTTGGAYAQTFQGGFTIPQFVGFREMPIPYEAGSDIFIAKISSDGKNLLASTYLGGTDNDGLNPINGALVQNYGDQMRGDIITDKASGDIFISTVTASANFPAVNSFNTTYHGGSTDALVMRLKGDLSAVLWGALMGGAGDDASHTIQIDKSGNIFVAGGTTSTDFAMSATTYQGTLAGNADGWIAKIKGDGSQVLNSTLTGTANFDEVYFLDIDQSENVYVYGQTNGSFPVSSGVYSNAGSGQFLQKFNNTLDALIFSTVFGSGTGLPNISPTAFLVNDCNNIYLSGWGGKINYNLGYWQSTTRGMPVTSDAIQKSTNGSDFYFIVLSDDAKQLLYATYLGGGQSGTHVDGGTCRFDKSGVVYHSVCAGCAALNSSGHSTSDFPTTSHAWSKVNGSSNCNNAAFKFDLSSLKARIQTNSIKLNQPGLTLVCLGDPIVFQNRSIGGQFYDWDLGDGTTFAKLDTLFLSHIYAKSGKYTVKLKIFDKGTCAGSDSTKTIVSVYDREAKVGPDLKMCFDSGTQLQASGGVTYQWTASDGSFTSSQATPGINPKISTAYYITVTDQHGCVVKDTVNVKVVPGIDIKMKLGRNFDCLHRPTLSANNLSDTEENLFFDFGDGTTSDEIKTIHTFQKDGTYVVKLVGVKEDCVYEQTENVRIYQIMVPNVFTPDETIGFNDSFKIRYGEFPIVPGASPPAQLSVSIYNRWGKQVYQNPDYRNDWTAKDIEAGVYYYEVTIKDETTCKGWVHVIK
jgi:hypothetical protein